MIGIMILRVVNYFASGTPKVGTELVGERESLISRGKNYRREWAGFSVWP